MKDFEDFSLENIADCTHGIVVIDPDPTDETSKGVAMVHWVGYWDKPEKEDFEDLAKELSEDDQFGLVDIADRLEYIEVDGDTLRKILRDA